MSYRLACDLADKITAVASLGGNFYKIDEAEVLAIREPEYLFYRKY